MIHNEMPRCFPNRRGISPYNAPMDETTSGPTPAQVWATFDNPDAPGDNPNGLNGPSLQVACLQTQTGDPGTPQANPGITGANPVELIVDWSMAYEPA